jgi:anti-anti-sigma regulatory factor
MNMVIENSRSQSVVRVSRAMLQCSGSLDRLSYQRFLELVLAEIKMGAQEIILDLSQVDRVSIAGMVGLYLAGAMLEGKEPQLAALSEGSDLSTLDGWEVIHRMCEAIESGTVFERIQLVSPSEPLHQSLTAIGMDRIMRILPRLQELVGAPGHA